MLSGYLYMSGHHLVTGLLSVTASTDAVWLLVSGHHLVTGLLSVSTAGADAVWLLASVWSPFGYWSAVFCCWY